MHINLSDIPQEFIEEYDLTQAVHNGWIHFEILRGCYGLPQSGILANDLLRTRLEKAGYYKAATTPGIWSHKWRRIQFVLLVEDFGIEYVVKEHALHILKTLKQNYEITTDWGDFFCRDRPCMGVQCQARQSELPYLHGWVYYKSAPQIWIPPPQKNTTLTSQTS